MYRLFTNRYEHPILEIFDFYRSWLYNVIIFDIFIIWNANYKKYILWFLVIIFVKLRICLQNDSNSRFSLHL